MQRKIPDSVYINPQASVIGNVEMGDHCSVWPGAVIRADLNSIRLGEAVNIQDNTTLHTDLRTDLSIGDYTLVGHNAMLHGCKIGSACLIGIGCIILDDAEIGDGAMITAGCLIRGGMKIPPLSLVVQKNGEIKVYPGKSKPRLSVAGCLEYRALAANIVNDQFGVLTQEDENRFLQEADQILESMAIQSP